MTDSENQAQQPASAEGESMLARSYIYRLLSEVFERIPDVELIAALRAPEFADAMRKEGYDFGLGELPAGDVEAALEVRVDFTQLFVGPGSYIPRYGSLFDPEERASDGRLWSDTTAEADRFMRSYGMTIEKGRIPDHVAIEMSFMGQVVAHQAALLAEGNASDIESWQGVHRKFLSEFLLPWVPRFCQRVIEDAKLPFYREAARLMLDFLRKEESALNDVDVDASSESQPDSQPPGA